MTIKKINNQEEYEAEVTKRADFRDAGGYADNDAVRDAMEEVRKEYETLEADKGATQEELLVLETKHNELFDHCCRMDLTALNSVRSAA